MLGILRWETGSDALSGRKRPQSKRTPKALLFWNKNRVIHLSCQRQRGQHPSMGTSSIRQNRAIRPGGLVFSPDIGYNHPVLYWKEIYRFGHFIRLAKRPQGHDHCFAVPDPRHPDRPDAARIEPWLCSLPLRRPYGKDDGTAFLQSIEAP